MGGARYCGVGCMEKILAVLISITILSLILPHPGLWRVGIGDKEQERGREGGHFKSSGQQQGRQCC